MEKRAASKPSSFDGPHRHDDEHHDHKHGNEHRPPPLLRRYHAQDYTYVHHLGQDAHSHADDKIPPSAFARSRYRRDHGRRSSVYVPGEHGNTYIVSRAPSRHAEPRHVSADKQPSHAYEKRQADGNNLASGRIDIMGVAQSSGRTQRLASLSVDSTPIDWTSGQSSGKAFPLNASTTNRTQFMMVPTNDSDTGGMNKHVMLATQVFDAGSADMIMYCATYDSNPGTPSALLMTPCAGTAQLALSNDDVTGPCANVSSSKSQQSQIFSYNPISGAIEPILSAEGSSSNDSDISATCAGAKVRRDNHNATMSGSATPSSAPTSTAPTPSISQHGQNVTLVYVAGTLEVPVSSPSSGVNSTLVSTSATPSAHMNEVAVVTTTVTTTVVTTVTASGAVSPAKAIASVPTSPPVSASASTARTSPSSSSTTSSGAAAVTPPNAEESLEVEVVGVAPSTSDPAPTTTSSTTSMTLHSSATPTLDPEAVASLMVEQMPHRWRAIAQAIY